ncbi:MAG: 3-oxoacyl-[acyl-carrier-protein] reductase [Fimbriimonadaceae bacterium]|nr:3-oxoacyl-[acyl-carrier-protein] reductase [Fimbriimonadaceae bacterium]
MSESKVAVVTGASRGIGQAIAIALAKDGCQVACLASKAENAAETVRQITDEGGNAIAFGADLGEGGGIDALVSDIESQLGTPTILVNNAGLTRDTLLMRMSDEDWQRVIDVNLNGAYRMTKALLRGMMKARWGRIVSISSVVGLHGAPGQTNYAASKAALIGFTMSLAKEVGSRGITANAVAPGWIATDMTAELPEDQREHVVKLTTVGRLGEPEDISSVVRFLCSEEASFITGQAITVDGGLTL